MTTLEKEFKQTISRESPYRIVENDIANGRASEQVPTLLVQRDLAFGDTPLDQLQRVLQIGLAAPERGRVERRDVSVSLPFLGLLVFFYWGFLRLRMINTTREEYKYEIGNIHSRI